MNSFYIDEQTLKDLNIFGDESSIFKLFDHTKTAQGRSYLKVLMMNPCSDLKTLSEKQEIFDCYTTHYEKIPIYPDQLDFIEYYLRFNYSILRSSIIDSFKYYLRSTFGYFPEYYILSKGIKEVVKLLFELNKFLKYISLSNQNNTIRCTLLHLEKIINNNHIQHLIAGGEFDESKIKPWKLDRLFRIDLIHDIKSVLESLYQIDAYAAIGFSRLKYGFRFAEYSSYPEKSFIQVQGLYHPLINHAVCNDLNINDEDRVLLFTGANMSGKSVFLKALSICIYLAHLGFPVPVESMTCSIFKGLMTTINLPDSIESNQSQYWAEIMRVKECAIKMKEVQKIIVMFDELFRGTHTEDGSEALKFTVKALSKLPASKVFLSTHITSATKDLIEDRGIKFLCFRSQIIKDQPVFDYKLQSGVSEEKLGMYFFKKAGIYELLSNNKNG